ncbi:unnamed protein product, partial [Mesorhabditis belari]|uniref:Uncharacterized protein n=1 Tax=Mesorhabditis belari TaxID=2138241 RepID=A0AAF3E8G1_9BILA
MVCECFLKNLGYAALAWAAYKVLVSLYNIIYPFFLSSSGNLLEKAGAKWAVVTGSTDGIGKAYAFELASKGFNLLLISRTASKLEATKKEIAEKSNVEIKTFAFDFTAGNFDQYDYVIKEITSLDVGVLVNNVGLSYEYPERMHEIEGELKRVADITVVNTLPPTLLTAAVLSQMVTRNKGIVINLASAASYHTMTFWGAYSATKKYVQWLSAILRKEYVSTGIIIQTVCPMLVATNMSKVKKTSFFTPDAQKFARAALNTVGVVNETTGYFSHQIQAELLFSLPGWLLDKVIDKGSLAIRKAALRKKEREADTKKEK